jgi:hypothetical protein
MQINSVYNKIPPKQNSQNLLTFLDNNQLIINEIANGLKEYNIYCVVTDDFGKWNNKICTKPDNISVFSPRQIDDVFSFDQIITHNSPLHQSIASDLLSKQMLRGRSNSLGSGSRCTNLISKPPHLIGISNKQMIEQCVFGVKNYFSSEYIAQSWMREEKHLLCFANEEERYTESEKEIEFLVYVDSSVLSYQPNLSYISNFVERKDAKIITMDESLSEAEHVEIVDCKKLEGYMEKSLMIIDLSFDLNSIITMKAIRRNCVAFSNT